MKIVHVINSLEIGGAEGVLVRLVTNDTVNQHVIISLKGKCAYTSLLSDSNVSVYLLSLRKLSSFFRNITEMKDIILREKPDLIQSWMYHSNVICSFVNYLFRLKLTLYWNIRHSTVSFRNDKTSLLLLVVTGAILSRLTNINVVYCATSAAKAHFRLGYSRKLTAIIGNGYVGYPCNLFKSHVSKTEKDKFELGYFARYHPQKNHKKLFKVVAQLKNIIDIRLLLVGKGCDAANTDLLNTIKKLNLQDVVILKGLIEEPRQLMHECDYTILVSDYGEGYPNVIGESLSVGTPCITTDVGDARIILKNCGNLVEIHSEKDLNRQISAAWETRMDDTRYQELRLRCLQNFNQNLTVTEMVNAYDRLWKKKGNK